MDDYKKLVDRLRDEPKDSRKAVLSIYDLCVDAAYAIEILLDKLKYAEGERDVVAKRMIELENQNADLHQIAEKQETMNLTLTNRVLQLEKELHEAKSEIDAAVRDRETLQKELTAYKNTGLEPEDIKVLTVIHGLSAQEISRICKLYQVEKDGRLAEIPCKVGETVRGKYGNWSGEVMEFSINSDGVHLYVRSGGGGFYCKPEDIEAVRADG